MVKMASNDSVGVTLFTTISDTSNGNVTSENGNVTSYNGNVTSHNGNGTSESTFIGENEATVSLWSTILTNSTVSMTTMSTTKIADGCGCRQECTVTGYGGSNMAAMFLSGTIFGMLLACLAIYFIWKRLLWGVQKRNRRVEGTVYPGEENLYSNVKMDRLPSNKRLTISSRTRQDTPEVARRNLPNNNIPNLYEAKRNTDIYEEIDKYDRRNLHIKIKSLYSSPADCIRSPELDEYTLECYSEPENFDRNRIDTIEETEATNEEPDFHFILQPKLSDESNQSEEEVVPISYEYATVVKRPKTKVLVRRSGNSETVECVSRDKSPPMDIESCDMSKTLGSESREKQTATRYPSFSLILPSRGSDIDHVAPRVDEERENTRGESRGEGHVTEIESFGNIYSIRPGSVVYL